MEKRLFEILDEMNQEDTEKGTRLVEVANYFISADKIKQGAKISMGADEGAINQIASGEKIPLLVLVDKVEYFKRKEEPKKETNANNNEVSPICPHCDNPYPHLYTDGHYGCEECGHSWNN